MSFMNRLANAGNRFQGTTKKVLTVCSAGLLRSPTAANVLHREYGYNTRACGATEEYALIPLDAVLVSWADEIVFMQQANYDIAWDTLSDKLKHKKLVILNVPDMFEWGDPELQDIIKKQYDDHFIMAEAF